MQDDIDFLRRTLDGHEAFLPGRREAFERLAARLEWVKCSERMPPPGMKCNVMRVGYQMPWGAWFIPGKGWDGDPHGPFWEEDTVSHWMPMPEPPREP